MKINVKRNGKELILSLEGRLDTTTAPSLDRVITEEVDESTSLLLDLKALDYISSAGLRVLLNGQKKMMKNGSMKLCNVCDEVMEVFEMTGFADILTIE